MFGLFQDYQMDHEANHELPSGQPVTSEEKLRQFYGEPSQLSQQKFMQALDEHCQAMVQLSPFVCIATTAADGSLDVSPRGDPPGSIQILDPSHLLIPDRLGNNRLDTLTNLTSNPAIGLFFIVPGVLESLRVSGRAQIIHDDPRLERCALHGKVPRTGILVEVQKACLQCGKALKRGALWEETYRIQRSDLASFGRMLADQTDTGQTAEELDCSINAAYEKKLY
ncbi:MAG: pyridoxamine 5'-phosphate oxidase family protein [Pirellulaceae bacterium]|nr:pyridoxamine 5'-phosphate oxidase family protein [Pirellulaceae bacterium]